MAAAIHTKLIGTDEVHEYFAQLIRDVDVLVYGRKTYELMVPFWPDVAKKPFRIVNRNERLCPSIRLRQPHCCFPHDSLDSAAGQNTRIVRNQLQDEIMKLKQEDGKDILTGGVALPSQLIELGLIDEYRFVIQPFVVGEGNGC
jgi:dihydrofolate reductase